MLLFTHKQKTYKLSESENCTDVVQESHASISTSKPNKPKAENSEYNDSRTRLLTVDNRPKKLSQKNDYLFIKNFHGCKICQKVGT